MIVRHGYLVTEIYYPPYQQVTRHPSHSITKSFTSAMVGKAVQEGYIQSLQQKVLEFFPEIEWPEDTSILFTGSLKHDFHFNQVTFPATPPVNLLLPLRGHWQDETTFVEEYIQNLNTDIELVTEKFTFDGDEVTIEATLGLSLESVRVSGEMVK